MGSVDSETERPRPAVRRGWLIAGTAVAVVLLIADKTRTQAISGLVLVLIGVPVYFLWRSVEGRGPAQVPDGRA